MDKKQAIILGGVGVTAAAGLAWMLSRLLRANGGGNGGGGDDGCGSGYHWDAEAGACVPNTIPIDPHLNMDPDAIWARANQVCCDPDNLARPPVKVTGFKFTPSAPGQRQVLKNLWYWDNEFNKRPNSITYHTQGEYQKYLQNNPDSSGCVIDTYCDTYLGGGTWCIYEERPAGELGQLVRQYTAFDPESGYDLYEWQGQKWVKVFRSPYINDALFKHQNGVKVEYLSIGKVDVTFLSDVDYLIPPDMLDLQIVIDHPGDSERIPQLYGAPNTPGPSFIVGNTAFNTADRNTWLNLKAGVPYTLTVPATAYIFGAYVASMYGGDRTVAAGAYQGGALAPGAYTAKVTVGFPKACVMLYNRNWYYPKTTEQSPYTGSLTVYEFIASYSIGQNELLDDALKFWHERPWVCGCYTKVQFYHPEGQQTVATPKDFTIVYPFTVMV